MQWVQTQTHTNTACSSTGATEQMANPGKWARVGWKDWKETNSNTLRSMTANRDESDEPRSGKDPLLSYLGGMRQVVTEQVSLT